MEQICFAGKQIAKPKQTVIGFFKFPVAETKIRSYLFIFVGLIFCFIVSCKKTDNDNIITDIEGNIYHTVTIGKQVWMVENLKVTRYRNGDIIGTTTPATLDISGETNPKYQWAYEGNESNVNTYGRLYTWYVINDNRKVCPLGWHIPTFEEWVILGNYLIANGFNFDGALTDNKYAKSLASSLGWGSETSTMGAVGNADYPTKQNATGFTALPGGLRVPAGTFEGMIWGGTWWSLTSNASLPVVSIVEIYFNESNVSIQHNGLKNYGFSVRCIKD